jgi:hypothetical protein
MKPGKRLAGIRYKRWLEYLVYAGLFCLLEELVPNQRMKEVANFAWGMVTAFLYLGWSAE